MLNRQITPQFKEVDHIEFINAEQFLLDNEIPVFIVNAGEQNLLRIEFIFKNVNWDASRPLVTSATNAMLNDGTHSLTGAQIASKIDYYGAFFQTEFGLDRSSVILYSLNKHLEHTLPIVKEVITGSNFPAKEFKTFITNQRQKLKVSLEKNDFIARRKFNQVLFGDTLYGYGVEEQDYELLKREHLQEYFSKSYHPKNCTIIISGKIDDSILQQLNKLFGSWKSDETFIANEFKFAINFQKEHYIERPQALQSAIRIGIPTGNRNHPDFPAMQVLNTVLGGYFGSRLMNNIREDKGYTYGIGSANASLEQSGYFFIASEVGTDVCAATLIEIEKEINRLKSELISPEELALVKNYLMGSLLGSLENAFSHADKFKNIYFYNLDYNYFTNYINTIKTIQAEELMNLANKYWDFNEFYKIVVGKLKS